MFLTAAFLDLLNPNTRKMEETKPWKNRKFTTLILELQMA